MRITTPENDIQKVLFTQEQINARVKEMGAALAEEYRGKQPLMVCILKGSIVFFADLIRNRSLQGNGLRGVYGLHSGVQLRRKL